MKYCNYVGQLFWELFAQCTVGFVCECSWTFWSLTGMTRVTTRSLLLDSHAQHQVTEKNNENWNSLRQLFKNSIPEIQNVQTNKQRNNSHVKGERSAAHPQTNASPSKYLRLWLDRFNELRQRVDLITHPCEGAHWQSAVEIDVGVN